MSKKSLLKLTAMTSDGLRVFGGVFAFYETHGIPLDCVLQMLWDRQSLPDWVDLVRSMVKAGRPTSRSFQTVRSAVNDACYPPNVRDAIQRRLSLLENRWEDYAVS